MTKSEIKLLGKDGYGRRLFTVQYEPQCLKKMPWGRRRFDCGVFVFPSAPDALVEQCIREVVRKNNDWVVTFGAGAMRWHDLADQVSVEIGRQKEVGDGIPMTTWNDDAHRLNQVQLAACHGAEPFLLILVGGTTSQAMARTIADKLRRSRQRVAAARR